MAEHQPSKAGAYERPSTGTSRSLGLMIGIIVLLAVIIAAILFFR
jgi:LPXTG-motif cell wall-anchored protein